MIMNVKSLFLALSAIVGVPAPAAQQEVRWERVANLNTPHQYHACVALNGKIYTVGGDQKAAFEEYERNPSRILRIVIDSQG
jgi:hypothetical protein